MNSDRFQHFGELYRAAFAERDPEKKSMLLSEVKRTIEQSDDKRQSRSDKRVSLLEAAETQTA